MYLIFANVGQQEIPDLNHDAFRTSPLTEVAGHLDLRLRLMFFNESEKGVQYAVGTF